MTFTGKVSGLLSIRSKKDAAIYGLINAAVEELRAL